MRIIGHGIDLVDVARFSRMLDEHGDRFVTRCFTEQESSDTGEGRRRAERLAGRFAAKEAVLKAIGTGLTGGVRWTEVEVVREPSGRPSVRLHGRCAEEASRRGIDGWLLSITHVEASAMASAIATSEVG